MTYYDTMIINKKYISMNDDDQRAISEAACYIHTSIICSVQQTEDDELLQGNGGEGPTP
jgi:hypothetical protein